MNCNKSNRQYYNSPGGIGQQQYRFEVIFITNVLNPICRLYTIKVDHEETTLKSTFEFGICDVMTHQSLFFPHHI